MNWRDPNWKYVPANAHATGNPLAERVRAHLEAQRIAKQQAQVRAAQDERREQQHQDNLASIWDRRRKETT
ncbi:MAG TPA: hypothetical protein VF077_13200 [Nitrospiraceae bacterium]